MNKAVGIRTALMMGTVLGSICLATAAFAEDQAGTQDDGLQEIIVTAQKREQSAQDVPIAITAISPETLAANRVTNVADLNGLAPGVTVRPALGGTGIPTFAIRGATSFGVVAGSDKQVSIYLDGVYISSPRGSIFDLPDVARLEVLRGPQGTLFGRNATAGAISVITRDPTGEVGARATGTYGNYDQYRFGVSVDFPQIGPFSAYVSYVHRYKRGDIRNAGAGTVWDYRSSAYAPIAKVMRSPDYLGTVDTSTYFGALKFESGSFTTVYKYDRTDDNGTPEGVAFGGYDPSRALIGPLLTALINTSPIAVVSAADGRRPEAANNAFTVQRRQKVEGHSLVSTLQLSDSVSLKNTAAFRKSEVFSSSPLDGLSSLTLTDPALSAYAVFAAFSRTPALATAPAATQQAAVAATRAGLVASGFLNAPFVGIGTISQSRSRQWSDELQLNYTSDFLTATAGGLYFISKDYGGENLQNNSPAFSAVPGGAIARTGIGRTFNEAKSLAAYAQLEFHVTSQFDIVLGGRVTQDKKKGSLIYSIAAAPLTFTYEKTKPTYLIGLNYKPNADTLLYAKYSTAYVSGGAVGAAQGDLAFKPETAKSWEAGIKADLFNHRLRTSLAAYSVTYRHVQAPQGLTNFRTILAGQGINPTVLSALSIFVADQGTVKAKGFEFDLTARPVNGLTLGGSLGYNDTKFSDIPSFGGAVPILISANGGAYVPGLRPKWTGNAFAQYDARPFAGGAYLSFRGDAIFQSRVLLTNNPNQAEFNPALGSAFFRNFASTPPYWIFNGRIALKDLDLGGVKTEFAIWGRNLTNRDYAAYPQDLKFVGGATFIPARTYGVDATITF